MSNGVSFDVTYTYNYKPENIFGFKTIKCCGKKYTIEGSITVEYKNAEELNNAVKDFFNAFNKLYKINPKLALDYAIKFAKDLGFEATSEELNEGTTTTHSPVVDVEINLGISSVEYNAKAFIKKLNGFKEEINQLLKKPTQ